MNDLIVITGKPGMKQQVEATLKQMQRRLEKARTSVPVHTKDKCYYPDKSPDGPLAPQ